MLEPLWGIEKAVGQKVDSILSRQHQEVKESLGTGRSKRLSGGLLTGPDQKGLVTSPIQLPCATFHM